MRQTLIFILWFSVILFAKKGHGATSVSFATSDLPGLLSKGPAGAEGFFADLFSMIKNETKLNLSLRIYPWARAQKLVSTGDHEVLVGPYRSVDREMFLNFGNNPIYEDRIVLVTTKDAAKFWHKKLKDIDEQMIIVMRGWYYGEEIKNFLADHKKVLYAGDLEQAQKLLLYGRGKFLFINERSYHYYKKRDKFFENNVLIYPNVKPLKGYIAYSKKTPNSLVEQIENTILKLTADGRLDHLQKKYHLKF